MTSGKGVFIVGADITEFLPLFQQPEADLVEVKVDLEFKECLRDRLWSLVERRNRMRARKSRGCSTRDTRRC